jgi:hypothetical protein
MERKQESPWTVGKLPKGSKQKHIKQYTIAFRPLGQAGNLAIILALAPCFEMVPAALLVAIAGGSLWMP